MRRLVVDGVLCERLELDPDDPALTLGFSAFETLRAYGGRPFRLDEHLARLVDSAAWMGLPAPDRAALRADIGLLLDDIGYDVNIRITLTPMTRIVRAAPLGPPLPPARVATRSWTPPPWLPGAVKHSSRAGGVLALRAAGTDELIWLDEAGFVLEGTRSNLFAVCGGVLVTPPADGRILAGVTRGAILDVAASMGLAIQARPLRLDEALDELYLSSTLQELRPIIEVDGQPAPGAGPVGAALRAGFAALVAATPPWPPAG